ncbi:hypothetical protein GON03_23130 [Nocardioides sp. MAH-18]|uniref:Uncharacterized protein n=1 Tax=Nocardioides agri TaxID=2682843 RepID=A0A6L6Y089_9ACTN|nr:MULTISPECIES: hypothetical protein [unclassified Nocardioides]MBA2952924.1 hypothetical protein [Nocardioides sp. CGMCC 1.13656]MVQ52086.1 hypothetical protein [Nocardioides sp. MAH-18]
MTEEPAASADGAADQWATQPTLAVWSYDSPMGASAGYVRLRELQRRGGVSVADVVTVTWVPGTHRPRIGHLRAPRVAQRRFTYSVLGALADVLTLAPGAVSSNQDPLEVLSDFLVGTGLDEGMLRAIRSSIAPGSSVMLVLAVGADPGATRRVIQRGLDRGDVTLAYAVLAVDVEERLRTAIETLLLDLRPHASPAG